MPSRRMASPRGTSCNSWPTKGIPCGIGWSTGGRSYGVRKSSRDMSMRAKQWSPAQMELPMSKNDLEIGSKSKIR